SVGCPQQPTPSRPRPRGDTRGPPVPDPRATCCRAGQGRGGAEPPGRGEEPSEVLPDVPLPGDRGGGGRRGARQDARRRAPRVAPRRREGQEPQHHGRDRDLRVAPGPRARAQPGHRPRRAVRVTVASHSPAAESRLTVLAGPTAVGKGTVSADIRRRYPQVWLSVSAT